MSRASDAQGANAAPMTIDAHQHFWRYNPAEHTWMTEAQGRLKHDHLPADLAPLMASAGVTGTIAVQARRTLHETEWLLQLASQTTFILGVVGWFDLASPKLEEDIERFAADPRLVGGRELIHDMPAVDYALSREHRRGIEALRRAGLAYDLLIRPQHLQAATALVDAFPTQRFVIDHLAKPDVRSGTLSPWSERLGEIARRENVYCKLSGLVTEADWDSWEPADLVPYIDVALEAFGADRVMFGSDWPVCTCAASYATTVALVEDTIRSLSADEKAAVMGGNAARFYGLP